jgi:hypothetical protein
MGKPTSVRPPPPTPVMALEAAPADAELASHLEMLADLDDLHRGLGTKMSTLEALLASAPVPSPRPDLASCLRLTSLLRDRLDAASDMPGTLLQVVPSDMMLLAAIRDAYRWSIQALDRLLQLATLPPGVPAEPIDPGAALRPMTAIRLLYGSARDISQTRALSVALDAVIDAIGALAGAIQRIEQATLSARI